MRDWYTAAELTEMTLPGLPSTERACQILARRKNWRSRRRQGRGGGLEYHVSALPKAAQIKLAIAAEPAEPAPPLAGPDRDTLWEWYGRAPEARRAEAQRRLETLDAVEALYRGGMRRDGAVMAVAAHHGVGPSSIYNWMRLVQGRDHADWLPALLPRHAGRTATVECSPEAWDFIRSDYLRDSQPPFATCYHNLKRAAAAAGWSYPSERTLYRRLRETVHPAVIVLARQGAQAAARLYPAQERDRSHFSAMEAVNTDGHTLDVMVRSRDGERILRPKLIGIQDLYSGMIVAWRLAETENSWAVRLAIGDMVENYGIPRQVWLDNGRAFASKWLTGGTPTRFRFTVREEDPVGILTQLIGPSGIHWTTPYHGQAKPIERAWRDLANSISRSAFCAGAYTGPNPTAKPESYASRALKWDEFEEFVASEIHEHNDRPGRDTRTCAGRSFRQTFNESYARHPVIKANDERRRLWLLAAEGIQASKRDGSLTLMGNRYWAEFLHLHMGEKLAVRFDPDHLHDGIHVYRLDGAYLGSAPVVEPVGFDNADAAREHARGRKQWLRGMKMAKEAEVRMSPAEVAAMIPRHLGPAEAVTAKVVQLARPATALKRPPTVSRTQRQAERHEALIADFGAAAARQAAGPPPDERSVRLTRAQHIEAALAAGREVEPAETAWFSRYSQQPEWRAFKRLAAAG